MRMTLPSFRSWLSNSRHANAWALLVGCAVFAILCWLIPAQGLTDDDDFYAPAGIAYFSWVQDFLSGPLDASQVSHIDRSFRFNKEHPPIAKYSIGFFEWLLHQKFSLLKSLDAARAGVAFFASLLAAFLFRLLFTTFGAVAAGFAVLALFSLPRFLFHSQVATLDVPVASLVTITTAAFWWSLNSKKWVWGLGLIFGLALGTKLNAPFVALGFVLFFLLEHARNIRLDERQSHFVIPAIPYGFWAMLLVSPLVFFLTWPHLWHDTGARLLAYIKFHMNHYPILVFYQGTRFSEPHAPWHMPFNMAAGTIPLPLLAIGLWGAVSATLSAFRVTFRPAPSSKDRLKTLVLIQLLLAIGIVAFTHVPKYGGEKLFMPFFPLFCLLAGCAFSEAIQDLRQAFLTRVKTVHRALLIGGFALVVLGPGYLASHHFHGGYALSYYSEYLGGLRGATAAGYERTYYDVADKSLARWLDQNVAPGAKVHFEPNHKEYKRTYKWLRKDGYVSKRLKLSAKWRDADYIVLTHERRWAQYSDLLQKTAPLKIVYEKRIDDVPLYTVYKK